MNLKGPQSQLEDIGFLVDVPPLPSLSSSSSASDNPTHTSFSRDLLAFLQSPAPGYAKATPSSEGHTVSSFFDLFSRYDFSTTKECRLVWSLGGKRSISDTELGWGEGTQLGPGGMGALARAVRGLRRCEAAEMSIEELVRCPFSLFSSPRLLMRCRSCRVHRSGSSTRGFSKLSGRLVKASNRKTAFVEQMIPPFRPREGQDHLSR